MSRLGTSVLGSRPLSFAFSRVLPGLRVLAYHDVPDPVVFREHLAEIRRTYQPVGAPEVVDAVAGRKDLPRRAVWVTFDDGHPSTFAVADDLARAGVSATAFVCPSVIDTRQPFWWQVVDEATRRGLVPAGDRPADSTSFRAGLKTVDDDVRRRRVEGLRDALAAQLGSSFEVPQATSADLQRWVDAGHHLGNHTWDHPLLDFCPEAEQERQIVTAHQWLQERFPAQPLLFAYPNGNTTEYADKVALGLGYQVRTLFDHRLAPRPSSATAVSRLRIDAGAPAQRFRAIASGAHPVAFAWSRR